ncbi:hypothetical protein ACQKLP_23255 [Chitinophaga sp. NPDC101104]|uniref:hypothetical protein n=1 Tax=Chitinophaga sp. NPDC101104 TaxID=3390561 RepID=UPI003CFE26A2
MATTTRKTPVKKKPATRSKPVAKKKEAKKDAGKAYDEFKEFEGQHYTGMRVGRSHKWKYDAGDWKETKITPDLWEISYAVTKRRAGRAPEGSGVPTGTEYHWYILAHQHVRKLNANDYTTSMTGLKYKLAHKRADRNKWSATAKTQRKRLVKMLQEIIAQLEKEPVPLEFEYDGKTYKGEAFPISPTCHDGVCDQLEITLNDENLGIIRCMKSGWKLDGVKDQGLIDAIGEEIFLWFE